MTMITPSYLGETIEYSSLHACRSTLEDPTFSVRYDTSKYTQSQNDVIDSALDFAVRAHTGQLRASGEPYIIHPIAVAETVASWGLDHEAITAAILHDVAEDTGATLDELSGRFGIKVAELVDGVTKLRLSSSPRPPADSARLETSNENLRKLLLATAKDYRVILIKLADRLHNMRTLGYLPVESRKRIARESLDIYAPLADRLGMGEVKGELSDLGFKYSQPVEYADLERQVKLTAQKAQRYMSILKRAIRDYVEVAGVKVIAVEARQKHLYSIWRKLQRQEGDLEKVYDFIAVRVIVPDVASCYHVLGIIHQHYKPLIYRIKDYIAVPKTNGYQSLHTTVFAEDGHITEIQIRTPEMHEFAEHGLAAHFFYDQQKLSKASEKGSAPQLPRHLQWVRRLTQLQEEAQSPGEFVEGAMFELFGDRIFAFSPLGDLYELPNGSTPLDFAFAVHSDVGLRAMGAKVNGKMMPLDSRLENRDVVEIVTRREASPNLDWLGFVATSHAKNRIRQWFRAASRDANIANGRILIEEALRTWGIRRLEELPKRQVNDVLDDMHLRSVDDMLVAVGDGSISASGIIRRLIPDAAKPKGETVVRRSEPTGRVLVEGDELPYTLASCCQPRFPQPLLGYVTRGKGVTVHVLGCKNVPHDVDRYITCRWETARGGDERVVCQLEIRSIDRVGLITEIASLIAQANFQIDGLSARTIPHTAETLQTLSVEVPDLFALDSLLRKLERIPGVVWVRRVV